MYDLISVLELREARTNVTYSVYKYVAALICLTSRKRFPSWYSAVQSVCDHVKTASVQSWHVVIITRAIMGM